MRRMQTFGGMDWLVWSVKMILSVLIDAIDIIVRLGLVTLSWGLSLAIPDPVNFILNILQVLLASAIWGKADAALQLGETLLEFVPVAGKVIDFTPVLTIGGIMYLLGEVDPSQIPARHKKSRGELVQLWVILLVCGGMGLVLWHFHIASWSTAVIIGLVLWTITWGIFQVDWARVTRPAQRVLTVISGIVIGISLLPVGYYAVMNPENLRSTAWQQMTDKGLAEYFPGIEERAKEWEVKANGVSEAAKEIGANRLRDSMNEIWSLILDTEVKRREENPKGEETKIAAEIQELRDQGLDVRSALDIERYRGPVTLKVANQIRRQRAMGFLAIGGGLLIIMLLILLWPAITQVPLKPDSRLGSGSRTLPEMKPTVLVENTPPKQIDS